jgi:hypothetical protein
VARAYLFDDGFEPVSGESRTCLRQRHKFLAGKSLAEPETGSPFLAATACSARQRRAFVRSKSAKSRKVKGNFDRAGKSVLRRTAWWSWQDSNRRASDYEANLRSEQLTTATPMGSCARAR